VFRSAENDRGARRRHGPQIREQLHSVLSGAEKREVRDEFLRDRGIEAQRVHARADDVAPSEWAGFHRIEKGLFQDKSLAGLALYGDALVGNVQKLQALTKALEYQPFELANGAQELLDEVSRTKVTGEEERYSHIDLLDFQSNVEGSEQAFADLKPALQKIDPALTGTIADAFTRLDKLLETYRSTDNPSGFVLYGTLQAADKPKLVAAVKAVQEPLSQVAAKVTKS